MPVTGKDLLLAQKHLVNGCVQPFLNNFSHINLFCMTTYWLSKITF